MEKLVSRLWLAFALVSPLSFSVVADAQISLDREPPGPSSRRTGLAITEIMYNPRPIPGLATNLTKEFVELFNSKPWDEDISGFSIAGSVNFVFPPDTVLRAGAYLVVARVPDIIRTNYNVTNVFGPWLGAETNRLSTEEGVVQLLNRQGGFTGPRVDKREGMDKVRAEQGILRYRAKFNCTTRLTNRLFFSAQTGIDPRCLRDLNIPLGQAGPFRVHFLSDG